MGFVEQLDPEAAALLDTLPETGMFDWDDLAGTRAALDAWGAQTPDLPQVTKKDHLIQGAMGGPEVRVRVYHPVGVPGPLPGLVWIHGGGMVFGSIMTDDLTAQEIAADIGCVVVSVEYRLAPEHPFPAAVEDCYAADLEGGAPPRGPHGDAATGTLYRLKR